MQDSLQWSTLKLARDYYSRDEAVVEFKEVLDKAWTDVSAVPLPEHLQEVALAEAIRYYSGGVLKSPVVTPPAPGAPVAALAPQNPAAVRGVTGGGMLDALSIDTGVPRDLLDEFFYVDPDGQPQMNLPARRLGANTSERARTIAITLAAARHFGLDELEISIDTVRDQCIALGAYDSNNFTAQLGRTPGLTLSGPPRGKKVLRAKSDLAKHFAATIATIFGSGKGD